MVLGTVAAQLPSQVRRGAVQRFPDAAAAAVVRRGLPHAGAEVLDGAVAPRDVHEPVRTHGDHHRQQLLQGAEVPGGRPRVDPDRDAVRRRGTVGPE